MESSGPTRRAALVRIGLFALLVVGFGVVLLLNGGRVDDALAAIRGAVDAAGTWGPVVFVVVYAVAVALLVPASALTVGGGLLFGPLVGTALVVVGATLGGVAGFVWGRRFGRDAVRTLAGDRLERVDEWLGDRGLVAVLYLRLVPVVPYSISNPIVGVTGVRLRDFTIGTLLGIVPGSFAYAALGGSFDDPTSPVFLGALALLVALAVVVPWVDRQRRDDDRRVTT